MHGLYMDYPLIMYGFGMASQGFIQCAWTMCGICVDYAWNCMDCAWNSVDMRGSCMDYVSIMH